MVQVYAFVVAFVVQILVASVLHPVWFARYVRAKAEAQFPDRDSKSIQRYLSVYRVVNAVVAVLGLVLLGWLFTTMSRPDWQIASVLRALSGFTLMQMMPLFFASLIGGWIKRKVLRRTPPETKRTASLTRRGLFDIVSPFAVLLAVGGYVLFAAFMIGVQQHSVAGFPGIYFLRVITAVFILNAVGVYWMLYRRKKWPRETQAYRAQAVEVQVRITVYASIAIIAFVSLISSLMLLHLMSWAPFATSTYIVVAMLFTAWMLFSLRRQAEADRLSAAS